MHSPEPADQPVSPSVTTPAAVEPSPIRVTGPAADPPAIRHPRSNRARAEKRARASAHATRARKAKHGPGVGDPEAPIGIFDSGVGGLTVARSVIDQLPDESILYVGDTARGPYGPRPIAQVRAFALDVMDHLVDSGVKALVIACNSASAAVLRDARERYPVPVVEVIKPAVRRAVKATRSGNIGVIGTVATVTSGAYDDAFAAAPDLSVFSQACPRFVEFVEAGITTGQEVFEVAHQYLDPLLDLKIDTLVLGCTHYPLLTGVISYVCGDDVTLVSSAEETAKDVYRTLAAHDLDRGWEAATPSYRFLATGDPEPFARLGRRFLGPEVRAVEQTPEWVAAQ